MPLPNQIDPSGGQDEQRMSDPLTLPKYKVGKDVSPWPGVKIARAQEHLNALASRVGLWGLFAVRGEGVALR